MIKIVALAGSLRKGSYNSSLVKVAAEGASKVDAEVTYVDITAYSVPLFSEDVEADSVPEDVICLKEIFAGCQGILLASPEYNGSITGVLKNLIDWLSRPVKGTDAGSAFEGKVVGIMATSPGALGGLRGLNHTRDIMLNLGAVVYPKQVAVPFSRQAFDENRNLFDTQMNARVMALGESVAEMAIKLSR